MPFFVNKKGYKKPEIQKLALDDQLFDQVTGGLGDLGEEEKPTTTDPGSVHDETLITTVDNTSNGNGDVSRGSGRGGGCDGVAYHQNAHTFSSARNSGC